MLDCYIMCIYKWHKIIKIVHNGVIVEMGPLPLRTFCLTLPYPNIFSQIEKYLDLEGSELQRVIVYSLYELSKNRFTNKSPILIVEVL